MLREWSGSSETTLSEQNIWTWIWTIPLESNMLNLNSCECSSHFETLRSLSLSLSWICSRDSTTFPLNGCNPLGYLQNIANKNQHLNQPAVSSESSSKHLGIIELIGKSRHIRHGAHVVPCGPTAQAAHVPDVLFRQRGRGIELHEAVHRGELAAGTGPGP